MSCLRTSMPISSQVKLQPSPCQPRQPNSSSRKPYCPGPCRSLFSVNSLRRTLGFTSVPSRPSCFSYQSHCSNLPCPNCTTLLSKTIHNRRKGQKRNVCPFNVMLKFDPKGPSQDCSSICTFAWLSIYYYWSEPRSIKVTWSLMPGSNANYFCLIER